MTATRRTPSRRTIAANLERRFAVVKQARTRAFSRGVRERAPM
jgi:hypothetical protein